MRALSAWLQVCKKRIHDLAMRAANLVKTARWKFAFLRFASFSTARSMSTSLRFAFCRAGHVRQCTSHRSITRIIVTTCQQTHTSKLALGTTLLMKYAPCRFESLKLQFLQSAAVKLLRLKSCSIRTLQIRSTTMTFLRMCFLQRRPSNTFCMHTSPWKSRPFKSASPYCWAVPFPNSPPAAASYLFRSAMAGGLKHNAALKTAAVPTFFQLKIPASAREGFEDARTTPGSAQRLPGLHPMTFHAPDLKVNFEEDKLELMHVAAILTIRVLLCA